MLLIEDLSAERGHLVSLLEAEADIEVECLSTSAEAGGRIAATTPDVVILDLHPHDHRPTAVIERIMARTPTPILVLSPRIDDRDSPSAVEALVAGALDALPRPARWTPELGRDVRRTVRQLSKVHVIRHPRGSRDRTTRGVSGQRGRPPVVAVAASTGGPSALATLLSGLGGLEAPVLVVQHLHPDFTDGLVEWMARVCPLPVEIAKHRQRVRPGRVYVAPGERHLHLTVSGHLELVETPLTPHRPSADELFSSVADAVGPAGTGVLLTGMGDDGARGLLAIRHKGGETFAQDEATSTVFGMPKAAAQLGAVGELLPIDKLADAVRRAVREKLQA